jgi:hypothetical protein
MSNDAIVDREPPSNPMPPPLPPRPRADATTERQAALWRNIGKWTVAFILFLALSAMFLSLMLFQLTAEGASKRSLRRSVAALTEVDQLVARNYNDMQQQAKAARPGESVTLAGFPIAIAFTPDEVKGASQDQIRDMLLNRSADELYAHGTGSLRDPAANGGSVGRFSVGGLTDRGLGFLRSRNHTILGAVTIVLAMICAALSGALVMLCRGFGRIGSLGAVVFTAAIPLVLFGIGARFYMRILSDGDAGYIEREFLEIGQGLAWIPIRDGLAFLVLGAAFALAGLGCARWADRRREARDAYADAHSSPA